MHAIAAKAVAFGEALRPDFAVYARAVVDNAKALAETLVDDGLAIVSGGTDTHLMLVDLRPMGLTGRDAEKALERAGITCNKNGIPFDPKSRRSPRGSGWARRRRRRAASARPSSARSARWIAEVLRGLARQRRR